MTANGGCLVTPEPWDGVSYYINGDGNPVGMADDHPITEWVCWDCAERDAK